MTLKVIFTKRIETYKRMSVSCNVQALRKSQFLSIVWKSVLIFVQIQLHWCYIIYWFVVVYCWLKKIHCVDQFQKGEYVMTKAYLVDVLSWPREGKEQWESNKKTEVCGRSCGSGSWVKVLTRPDCQVKNQEAERWTLLNYWVLCLTSVSKLWIDFIESKSI